MKIRWEFIGSKIKGARFAPFIKSLIHNFSKTPSKSIIKALPNGWVKLIKLPSNTYKAIVYQKPPILICAVFGKDTNDVKNRYYYLLNDDYKLIPIKTPDFTILDNSEGGNGVDIPITTLGYLSPIIKGDDVALFIIGDTLELELGAVSPFNTNSPDFLYVGDYYTIPYVLVEYTPLHPIIIPTEYGNIYCYSSFEESYTFGNVEISIEGDFPDKSCFFLGTTAIGYTKLNFIFKNKKIEKEIPFSITNNKDKIGKMLMGSSKMNTSIAVDIVRKNFDNEDMFLFWKNIEINPIFDIKNENQVYLKDIEFKDKKDEFNHFLKYEEIKSAEEPFYVSDYKSPYDINGFGVPDWKAFYNDMNIYLDASKSFYKKIKFEPITINGAVKEYWLDNKSVDVPNKYSETLMYKDEIIDSFPLEETSRTATDLRVVEGNIRPMMIYFVGFKHKFVVLNTFSNHNFRAIIYRKMTLLEHKLYSVLFYLRHTPLASNNYTQYYDFWLGYMAIADLKIETFAWVNGTKISLSKTDCYIKSTSPILLYSSCYNDSDFDLVLNQAKENITNAKTTGGMKKDSTVKQYDITNLAPSENVDLISAPFGETYSDAFCYQNTRNFITSNDSSPYLLMSVDYYPLFLPQPSFSLFPVTDNTFVPTFSYNINQVNPLSDAQNLFDRRWFLWDTKGNYKEIEVPKDENGNHFERLNGLVLI